MKKVAVSEIKEALSRYLREAETEDVVITKNGKPVGLLIGFGSEDDWLDYLLQNHPSFLGRVARAREDLQAGRGIRLEDVGA